MKSIIFISVITFLCLNYFVRGSSSTLVEIFFHLTLICKSWKTHPEIFLKFSFSGSSHRPFYWKTHPDNFSKFQFWGVTQAVLLENSSIKNHGYLFSFFNFGASPRPFSWKTHPFKLWLKSYTGRFSRLSTIELLFSS